MAPKGIGFGFCFYFGLIVFIFFLLLFLVFFFFYCLLGCLENLVDQNDDTINLMSKELHRANWLYGVASFKIEQSSLCFLWIFLALSVYDFIVVLAYCRFRDISMLLLLILFYLNYYYYYFKKIIRPYVLAKLRRKERWTELLKLCLIVRKWMSEWACLSQKLY